MTAVVSLLAIFACVASLSAGSQLISLAWLDVGGSVVTRESSKPHLGGALRPSFRLGNMKICCQCQGTVLATLYWSSSSLHPLYPTQPLPTVGTDILVSRGPSYNIRCSYTCKTVTADRQVTSIPEADLLRVLLGRWTGTASLFVWPATSSTIHTIKRLSMKIVERILFELLVFANPLKRSENVERVQAG